MQPTILFATHNHGKAQLFKPLFAESGFTCVTLDDIGGRPVIEDGVTAVENALKKAHAYHSAEWPFVFADDAGVEIDALGGEPGVQTRRWGGRFTDDVDDEVWLAYLMERLRGVPLEWRTGRFVSGWALLTPDGQEHTHTITLEFVVGERQQRPPTRGFPLASVLLGEPYYIGQRREQIAKAWRAWAVLDAYASR
jgi:inosine/xanthosine triphosphate pyrophosphatase family protein